MDQLYSLTLGAAIGLAIASLGGLVASALLARSSHVAPAARRASAVAAFTSVALVLVSATVHLAGGHRPGSDAALGPAGFVREHPAVPAVAVIGGVACWWAVRTGVGRGRRR